MTDQEQGLKRELTARQMAMVAVGGSIGTGLLLGSGAAIQVAGPAVVLTFALSALISWTVAMALGEMSAVHPAAGSFGVYADLYLNRWAGFIARYGYWFAVVIVVGSEVVAAATYMRQWYPAVPQIVWMVTFGLFLLTINFFSVGHYGTFEYWFALLKVITIFVFIVAGAALLFSGKVQPQYIASGGFAPQGWSASLLAISFGLYSFLGIEMVAISSGEARSSKDVARATRIAFATLVLVYVGAMAVLVGVMPWKNAGVSESPFVTVFKVAGIPAAGFIMNFVVLSAALSGANASLYVASRMLFALARSGYAPQRMGVLNHHGVPMGALLVSMGGIAGSILLQLRTSNAYLYIINAALVGGMIAWLVSLLAHVRFRQKVSADQLREIGLRSPLGGVGSILGFVAIVAAIACTWWVSQSSVAAQSAGIYLVVLSVAYSLIEEDSMNRLKFLIRLFGYSRIMKWFFIAFDIFWFVQLGRDEFTSIDFAARHRIVDIIPHWNFAIWITLCLFFLLLTFVEGILRWHSSYLEDLFGRAGSVQHEAMEAATLIVSCVGSIHKKYGICPVPDSVDEPSLERQWNWQRRLSQAFDVDVKPRLRIVMGKLEREDIVSLDVQNAISLATITEEQALAAATALFQIATLIGLRNNDVAKQVNI